MEWNMKTPSQWELDNLVVFNWGTDNGSFYPSEAGAGAGAGACSVSDLGNGSSSKSSLDSSSKMGSNFDTGERFTHCLVKRKDGDTGTSPTLGASDEPIIGLKLGRRTYFEDACAGTNVKPQSLSPSPTSSSATAAKRSRASHQTPRCQVEGCNLDLTSAKDYHRRHRVCEGHSKCPRVVVAGLERRFCQQCSRFHDLLEFDEAKRSCRRRLSDHNARRRKPQPEAIQFNSGRMSSSFYDGRQQMNLLFNMVPLAHTRPAAKPMWDNPFYFKPDAKELVMKSEKGSINGQLHLPIKDLPNAISTVHRDSDRLLSFNGNNAEVLTQGFEAPVVAANSDATPDFRHALSLLSNNHWSSGNSEASSLDQLVHSNQNGMTHPPIHAVSQGWPLSSSEYWQADHQPDDSQVHSLASQINSGSQFQEFQLFKAPFESGYYNQMN